jgi:hypothetical protein
LKPVELRPDDPPPKVTSARRSCPVCHQVRVTQVCAPCGVDVDTGELVQVPARPGPPAPLPDARPLVALPPFGARDLGRELLRGAPAALVAAVVTGCLMEFRFLGGHVTAGFALAVIVMTTARAARAEPGRDRLVELGGDVLRAAPLFFVLLGGTTSWPATLAVSLAAPWLAGALASERPLRDLLPGPLWTALRRTPLLRTGLLGALGAAGPIIAMIDPETLTWPKALVAAAGALLLGAVAGLGRRNAEL